MANILLADDDAANRDLVKRALEADGHSVTQTEDGVEALAQLRAASAAYDVLVSDVDMPAMDGIALAENALGEAPGLRVLLMSGLAEALERATRLKSANINVLSKPFTLEQVRGAVAKLLA